MARTVVNSKPIGNRRWEIIDWQVDQPWEIVPPTHVPNFSTCKPRKFGSVILVSVTPITLFLLDMRWVLLTMRAFWNILFIRICVGVIEENKVYKDSYRRLGILIYIFENIQDDSVRWYPSVTKTSRQQLISYNILPSEWTGTPNASFTTRVYISLKFSFIIFYIFVNECLLRTNWAHCLFCRFKDGRSKNNYHCFFDLVPSDNKSTAEHSR